MTLPRLPRHFAWLAKVAELASMILGWIASLLRSRGLSTGQYEFEFPLTPMRSPCCRTASFGLISYMIMASLRQRSGPHRDHDAQSRSPIATVYLARIFKHVAQRPPAVRPQSLRLSAPRRRPRALGLTELGYHFIGGILRQNAGALCAVLAPTVNSYSGIGAPGRHGVFFLGAGVQFYGFQHSHQFGPRACRRRDAANRATRTAQSILSRRRARARGRLRGIREKIDPGDPNEDNLYTISEEERAAAQLDFLAADPAGGGAAFAADPLMRRRSGKDLCDEFVKYKTQDGTRSTSRSARGRSSATAICFRGRRSDGFRSVTLRCSRRFGASLEGRLPELWRLTLAAAPWPVHPSMGRARARPPQDDG